MWGGGGVEWDGDFGGRGKGEVQEEEGLVLSFAVFAIFVAASEEDCLRGLERIFFLSALLK